MNLEVRMRQSIKRRSGSLILRSEVAALGSQTQVSHVLDVLMHKGELIRLTRGIYAKAKKDVASGKPRPQGSIQAIISEAAQKLGLVLHDNLSMDAIAMTETSEILVETENPRIEREMIVDGKVVRFRSYKRKLSNSHRVSSMTIPTKGVAQFVKSLANRYMVTYTSNPMDQWAKAVTRLAGDEVKSGHIEDLIVALKRSGKISKRDVATLTVNYLREIKHSVRSV